MAGLLNIPKFVDFRNKVKRHPVLKFPMLSLNSKTTLAIHHSLTKQGLGGSNAEGYARYHVDSLGWPSIGYSYVIEPDGTIKFCNDIELRTYHVGDHNNYAIGICLTGDFRSEKPTKEQEESLRNLVSALQKEYPHIKHVKGHNEFSGYSWKECPVFDYKAVLANKSVVAKPAPSKPVSKPTVNPSGEYKGSSVVDYLKSKGIDSSFASREKLAKQHGIKNYKGTPEQNTLLLEKLQSGAKPKPQPKPKKEYVTLPASVKTWRTYKLNVAPVAKNSDWSLTPAAFGGLTYEVLGSPQANVVTINTSKGKRNIYVGPDTSAKIYKK
ncbi:peptidoglycan recognition protein family protein [Cytobacillus horneckiae]|uniref:peptidoglycan recognition protein family protein n=1 Tax=Cytobacillus horneckiae TaxID=549687 RepID=UPI003D9A7295